MEIPIVGRGNSIVGWTDHVPESVGGILRHAEAERLIGKRILCLYVEIESRSDAQRAGAPPLWEGPWRCLALCSPDAGLAVGGGAVAPTVHVRRYSRARREA